MWWVWGCWLWNLIALNYDSDATDQGNCEYLGCMDSMYFEYNLMLQLVMVLVTPKLFGCIDSSANNYNPNANNYDGSCTFDSGLNHIFISDQLMDLLMLPDDIIINFEFISSDITIGYSFQGADALIRYSINGGSLTNIASSSGEIAGELSCWLL